MKTVAIGGGNKVSAANTIIVGEARVEKNLQKWLDSITLSNREGKATLDKGLIAAQKEVEFVRTNRRLLATKQIKPVSDYAPLQKYYDEKLVHVTQESLALEAADKAEQKKDRFMELSPEMAKEIDTHFGIKARLTFAIIESVREVLEVVKSETKLAATPKALEVAVVE